MTVAEAMDLHDAGTVQAEILAELRALNEKMDRVERVIDAVTHRIEDLEEIRDDLWPMVQGVSHQVSRKLHEMEQSGTLAFLKEGAKVAEQVSTSFTAEDVRLLGENVVQILQTVRNLTQPGVLDVADRAATALRGEADGAPAKRLSLWKAMRDPEVRRGMTLMLSVLREMGHEGSAKTEAAALAAAAK
ncbi:MAG: hypothetical protein AMXMBFR53_17810 [Gemmatimonadota bacterium]